MILKNIYAKIVFQLNCLYFLSLGHNLSVLKKSGLYQNILSCVAMYIFKIRCKVKNHHISEAGVSFEKQFGLYIEIRTEHIF